MRVAEVQISPWDKPHFYSCGDLDLARGDKVIVKNDQILDLGTIIGFAEIVDEQVRKDEKTETTPVVASDKKTGKEENGEAAEIVEEVEVAPDSKNQFDIQPIVRKLTHHDLDKMTGSEERKKALEFCITTKEKHNLSMKIVDVHFSFDGSRITFAFIADGRVDFRELVKDLTRHFGRTIRLQQIGIRDEAKVMGDFGHCGKQLCCRKFLKNFKSITSEMADLQQCAHRGSERISGICGRLMCCLAYEEEGYEDLLKKLPTIGTKVNVDGKKGVIVGHHVLKQSVMVEFHGENGERGTIAEVDINRNKK
jgi:cell fate regulator YaaT (PSP1 superfamily)